MANAKHAERVEEVATGAPFEELPDDMLTVQDICAVTGLYAPVVRRAVNSGKIDGCKIGRRIFVAKPVFLRYVKCLGLA